MRPDPLLVEQLSCKVLDVRLVQRGPTYRCWRCGLANPGLVFWPVGTHYSPLDEFAKHIAYLRLPCLCHRMHGVNGRVAVWNGYITPLEFYAGDDWLSGPAFNVGQVTDALVYLREVEQGDAAETARNIYLGHLADDKWNEQEAIEREHRLLDEALMLAEEGWQ